MQRNFDLQKQKLDGTLETRLNLQEVEPSSIANGTNKGIEPATTDTHDWISAFNTSLLTTRATYVKDRSQELSALMQTPEFASLLVAAQHLAQNQGITKEEATERLIENFRKIDKCWKQIVLNRGLQSVIE